MKILYTYQGIMQKVGGVSRYFFENIMRIQEQHEIEICTRYLSNEYFKQIITRPTFTYRGFQHIRIQILLEQIHLILKLIRGGYDVVHLTGFETLAFHFTHKPIVITVHDMIAELYYKSRKRKARNRKAILRADAIICVSLNTRQDLLRLYPEVNKSKIHVIYHGYTPAKVNYRPVVKYKYILYVGSRYGEYKNFSFFIQAIAPLLKTRDLKLVCTGERFSQTEKKLIKSLNITDRAISFGFATDEELACLYHYAECFTYPSLYEGFGIPILEAFSHECPACISNSSCFPEVGSNAVAYFDPKNEYSIRQVISKVIKDRKYRQSLIERGTERIKFFSWDIAAEQTIKIYESVVK